jgi:hypothetical protein
VTSILIEAAARDLRAMLGAGPVEMHEALERMRDAGHPVDRTKRGKRLLGVRTIRSGPVGSQQIFRWELPTRCPTCGQAYVPELWADTPAAPTTEPGIAGLDQELATPVEHESLRRGRRLDLGPACCDRCGRAWALDPGQRCIARGCPGVVR